MSDLLRLKHQRILFTGSDRTPPFVMAGREDSFVGGAGIDATASAL
jgi:hypothetical protein